MSPTSPLYLVLSALTQINLLILSTTPATDAYNFFSSSLSLLYVPWFKKNGIISYFVDDPLTKDNSLKLFRALVAYNYINKPITTNTIKQITMAPHVVWILSDNISGRD